MRTGQTVGVLVLMAVATLGACASDAGDGAVTTTTATTQQRSTIAEERATTTTTAAITYTQNDVMVCAAITFIEDYAADGDSGQVARWIELLGSSIQPPDDPALAGAATDIVAGHGAGDAGLSARGLTAGRARCDEFLAQAAQTSPAPTTDPQIPSPAACATLVELLGDPASPPSDAEMIAALDVAWEQAMADGDTELANQISLVNGLARWTPGDIDGIKEGAANLGRHCSGT